MEVLRLVGNTKRLLTPKNNLDKRYIVEEGIKISNNKIVETEYVYDLIFKSNRLLDENEFCELQNVINSVFVRYGDEVYNNSKVFNEALNDYNKKFKFANVRDIYFNYLAKRYIMEKPNKKDYISDYVVMIDEENIKLV